MIMSFHMSDDDTVIQVRQEVMNSRIIKDSLQSYFPWPSRGVTSRHFPN